MSRKPHRIWQILTPVCICGPRCGILWVVNAPDPDAPRAFADALVSEIRAEMGRNGINSVRALAEMIGMNHVSLNDRLGPKRVPIGTAELYRICTVLKVEPWEVVRRAGAASAPRGSSATESA